MPSAQLVFSKIRQDLTRGSVEGALRERKKPSKGRGVGGGEREGQLGSSSSSETFGFRKRGFA